MKALASLVLLILVPVGSAAQNPWSHQAPMPTSLDLHGVHALSASEAWVIGDDGVLLHTIDGGATWDKSSLPSDSTWGVFFLDSAHGWAASNHLFHTVDGGQTWTQETLGMKPSNVLEALYFLDSANGWVGGTPYAPGGGIWSRSECATPVTYCTGGVNSTGGAAAIGHGGSLSVSANDFVLVAVGCPAGRFGLFISGQGRQQTPLGDGYLCISAPLQRFSVIQTDAFGMAQFPLDFTGTHQMGGAIVPGATWDFQLWYRDTGFGTGFNLTNGLEATFCQ